MRYEVYGGPYDGARVTCTITGDFVYTDGRKSFKEPGKGRVLCRRKAWITAEARQPILLYAEHTHARCPGCSVFHERPVGGCTLCGAWIMKPEPVSHGDPED